MWKVWLRPSMTSEATRPRYVLPILLYNCGTYRFRDTQPRKFPSSTAPQSDRNTISNDKLHDRTKTDSLQFHLLRSRWNLLGHILRRPAGIPAYRFMTAFSIPVRPGQALTNATDGSCCRPSDTFRRTPTSTCPRLVSPSPMLSRLCNLEGFDRGSCCVRTA
ncbi:hypothetical protein P3T76_014302 [Phytophthora citrophthora]|uniref:Uncharacterized protein n=1 Tax=Phytophthora citrophthora TaxID=4793 RepID=A0AAD9LB50_9STRA|nr:hypothetical protein P3T76_014302 [Phytophthora citrophthora]